MPGAIEVRRGTDTAVLQRIDLPASAEAPEIEVRDLNFDGLDDVRVIDVRPAGPNVTYLNWLYDPVSGRLVANEALNVLVAPEFDAARRTVRSSWRDGPTLYITETYTLRDGQLVPTEREVKRYSASGAYTVERSVPRDGGGWNLVGKRSGKDS